MAAPEIVYGSMPTTAKDSEAVGWFRITGQVDRLEFSTDGGTTWAPTAALAGGTLVGAVNQIAGQGSVTITPTTLGTHPFKVRPVSVANGAGAAFDASLVVISTSAMGIARIYDQRLFFDRVIPHGTGFVATGLARRALTDAATTVTVPLDNATISIPSVYNNSRENQVWVAKWDDEAQVQWVTNFHFQRTSSANSNGVIGVATDEAGDVYVAVYQEEDGLSYRMVNPDGSVFYQGTTPTNIGHILIVKLDGETGAGIWKSIIADTGLRMDGQPGLAGITCLNGLSTETATIRIPNQHGPALAVESGKVYLLAGYMTAAVTENGITVAAPTGGTTRGALFSLNASTGAANWGRIFRSSSTSQALNYQGLVVRPGGTQLALLCHFSNPGSVRMHASAADTGTVLETSGSSASGVLLVMNPDATGVSARQNMPIGVRGIAQDATGQNLYTLTVASSGNYTFGGGTTYTPSGQTVYLAKFNASTLALVSVTVLGAVASGGSVSSLGLTTDKDFGPLISGAFQVGFGPLTSQGGLDGVLYRLSPTDLSETFAVTAFRSSAAISDVIQWTGAHPSGGGVSVLRVAGGGVASTVQFSKGTAGINVPAVTGDHFALFTFDDDGVPEQLPGGPFVPPPSTGTVLAVEWPADSDEDETIMGSALIYNPEASTGYESLVWEVWDPTTADWYTGTRAFASDEYGRGEFTVTPGPGGTASLQFVPQTHWHGTLKTLLRARGTLGGVTLPATPIQLQTTIHPVYDPPEAAEGTMPDISEGGASTGTFTSFSPDGSALTWYLSPETTDPRTTISTTSITVYEDSTPVGTASIVSGQGSTSGTAEIRFEPYAHYHGSYSFSLRTGDGGEGIPGGHDGYSPWVVVNVTVDPVEEAPLAPTPSTMPTMEEDSGYVDQLFTVIDYDVDPGGDDPRATWQLSPVGTTETAREDFITTSAGVFEIIGEDEPDADEDLTATVRFVPASNFFGSYAFYIRAYKEGSEGPLYGAWTNVTGEVTAVPDIPTAPTPRTMPLTKFAEPVVQIFTTTDPDDGPWTWEISEDGSTWSDSLAALPQGDLEVIDQGTKTTTLRFTPSASFAGGRYSFWLRVSDSTTPAPLYSPAVRVTGVVSNADPVAQLVLLDRTETAASLRSLGRLLCAELDITESVTGPGTAQATVPAEGVRAMAAAEGWTVDELLSPGGIELHITAGAELLFAGPVTGHTMSQDATTIAIDADGLASYLESRAIEGTTAATYTAKRADVILWELIDTEQARAYGHLGFTDTTTPTGDPMTVTFDPGTAITEAIDRVAWKLGGPEWWITPEREVACATTRGTDRRESVLLTVGCSTIESASDSDKIATVADVEGNAVDGHAEAAAAVLARYGRRYERLTADRIDTAGAANALAAQHVADYGKPVPTRRLTHYVQAGGVSPWDYEVGDAVTVEDGLSRFGVRIINRTLRHVGPGAWVVDADVEVIADGPLRPARSRHLPRLYDQLYDSLYDRLSI